MVNATDIAGEYLVFVLRGTEPCGVGFFIDERLLLTCSHVVAVANELDKQDDELVGLSVQCQLVTDGESPPFEATVRIGHPARQGKGGTREERVVSDVALLEVKREHTLSFTPQQLEFTEMQGNRGVVLRGADRQQADLLQLAGGRVLGHVKDERVEIQVDAGAARLGFSGGPVIDQETGRVLGMVQLAPRDGGNARFITLQAIRAAIERFPSTDPNAATLEMRARVLERTQPMKGAHETRIAGISTAQSTIARNRLTDQERKVGMDLPKYRIFLSYKHGKPSTDYAKELYDHLSATAEGLGYGLYMDDEDNLAGDVWAENVDDALQKCTHFMVLLTSAYWLSKECRRELCSALERFEATRQPRLLFIKAEEIRPDLFSFDKDRRTGNLTSPDPQVRRVGDLHFLGPFDRYTQLVRLSADPVERTDQYAQLLQRLEATLKS